MHANVSALTSAFKQAQQDQNKNLTETLTVLHNLVVPGTATAATECSISKLTTPPRLVDTHNCKRTVYRRSTHDVSSSESEDSEGEEQSSLASASKKARHSTAGENSHVEREETMDLEGAADDILASGAEDDHNKSGPEDVLLGDYTQPLQLEDEVGDEIQPQLATLLTNMLTKKAEESALNKKADLYPCPSNVPDIVTPTVNKEIWGHIQKPCRCRDIKFQKA